MSRPSARPSWPSGSCAAGRSPTAWKEAGERLFTFLRYPPEQWRSLRTTNAIERLHEEFKRRIKTQCLLPCAETAAMLFWALLASGQITLRKVDGWDWCSRGQHRFAALRTPEPRSGRTRSRDIP